MNKYLMNLLFKPFISVMTGLGVFLFYGMIGVNSLVAISIGLYVSNLMGLILNEKGNS